MRLLAFFTVLLLPSLGLAEEHDHLSELDGLRALHGWARATTDDEALIFLEIENTSDDVVEIEAAHSAVANKAELVGFKLKNGAPGYTVLAPLPVAPDRELRFEPDGLAIRLTGLAHDLVEEQEFALRLETSLGPLELHVSVESANARQHSHVGHRH